MNAGDLSLVLTFGFVSSLHCVQMCGPIVLSYSIAANTVQGRRSLLGLHLSYNAGRSVTYMFLGLIAGFAGGAMGWVGQLAGFENAAAIAQVRQWFLPASLCSALPQGCRTGADLRFPHAS